ncbi:hypothetical protein NCLIV_023040 [Neospora caninum Liverpool]|uniref:WD domain, G-beta repeat-containing protein n=1 Tax=Neospora caninum (strain Liverpool) TaxID=572307 RepID=F0VFM1_NEOCL|nr:hypothetical protein NCLIV_023040 [Neospora caninum Liverpool]CBZ52515.1 hypothetical protein NCLIV_023040 [Neospora caninum Liverpool]CEL66492.1 TPA: WD domain, G-beta repeat-containing protein [Neospora caninum Liverpool]|eukprot:XP_003882547.1 hypothetical protein NCLIV_023040 [Neospora caninum Liverpool]
MAALATLSTFDTSHAGCLHSVEFDFFATRLATASSDRTIRLWSVSTPPEVSTGANGAHEVTPKAATFLQELRGHEGPVWQVRWAHPSFGNLLASCGYDRRVIIWQQTSPATGLQSQHGRVFPAAAQSLFAPVYTNEDHTASVNSIAFCPHELGLHLAAGSSDGSVSVLSLSADAVAQGAGMQGGLCWSRKAFAAHFNGVNSVAWAPFRPDAQGGQELLLATGGCDSQVRLWRVDPATQEWQQLHQLTCSDPHTDWVRDVAFQPASASSLLLSSSLLLASCSEDCTVKLWVGEASASSYTWSLLQTLRLHAPVWRVSWSVSGTVLSVACGEKDVYLFRETVGGQWEKVSRLVGPDSVPASPAPMPSPAPAQPGQPTGTPQGLPHAPQASQPLPNAAPPSMGAYPSHPSHPPSHPAHPPSHPAHPPSHPSLPPYPSHPPSHPSFPPSQPSLPPNSALPPSGSALSANSALPPAPAGSAIQAPQGLGATAAGGPGVSFPPAPGYPGAPSASAGLYGPPPTTSSQTYPHPAAASPYPPSGAFPPPAGVQAPGQGMGTAGPTPFFPAGTAPATPKPPAFYNVGAPEGQIGQGQPGAAPPTAAPFFPGGQAPGVAPPPTSLFPRPPQGAPGPQAQQGYAPRAPMYTPYKAN